MFQLDDVCTDSSDSSDETSENGRKFTPDKCTNIASHPSSEIDACKKKFVSLQKKAEEIRNKFHLNEKRAEFRRSQKLIKKALKDPSIREEVEKKELEEDPANNQKESWQEIKPFLNVNNHLQDSVSHRDYRPMTELECKIEEAIKEGDLEEAEVLSDTLANREFAVKISQAFSAKRCSERLEEEKEKQREIQCKKKRWTFEAKERWQMKGNM